MRPINIYYSSPLELDYSRDLYWFQHYMRYKTDYLTEVTQPMKQTISRVRSIISLSIAAVKY